MAAAGVGSRRRSLLTAGPKKEERSALPRPRPVTRPPAPTADERALERLRERFRPLIDWKEAVHAEAWRAVWAAGSNHCREEDYERARQTLIDRGWPPPEGWDTPLL